MKNRIGLVAALLLSGVVVASGDWDPGGPFKMHYPQLPDPTGWDVSFEGKTLADDFRCTETGPITGIHFWVSWRSDAADWKNISSIHLSIHEDIPVGSEIPYSRPKDPAVWALDLGSLGVESWTVRPYGAPSPQGWFDPVTGQYTTGEHEATWQINVASIQEPFVQEKDKIYWLDVRIDFIEPGSTAIGWKTSGSPHFNDDAVWSNFPDTWSELRDPIEPAESLDLAFVIVPEPTTGALVLLFGAAALVRRRLRRG